jgi:hypothetical protein
MEKINLDIFINKASKNASFLRTYVNDPARLADRYIVEDDLIEKLNSSQVLLEAVANLHPKKLSSIAKGLFDPTVAAFQDFRDAGGYTDGFNDGASDGGFVDRYEGPKHKLMAKIKKEKFINPGKGNLIKINQKGKM